MPFPIAGFEAKEDSAHFEESSLDATMRQEIDGGYVVTRKRFTRTPPRTFKTGFTAISDADKLLFEAFYREKQGADSFVYVHPVTSTSYTVRFISVPQFKYVGVTGIHLWNITDIALEQV